MNWIAILSVAVGAAAGGVLRHLLSVWMRADMARFPWHTLIINLSGSLFLGILWAYFLKHPGNLALRLALTTGFCGGFTTFSTFSLEMINLFQKGQYWSGGIYLFSSVLGGVLLAGLGFALMGKN